MADKKYNILLSATDQTKAAFDTANRNIESMTGGLLNMRSLLGGVSAVSFVALIKSSTDAADQMSKSAQKVGITTEALSRLKYAAELADVPFENLEKSLTKLSRAAYDATATGGASAQAFTQMGIATTDASGRLKDSAVLMSEVADKFARMENGSAKTALSMALFGKAGAEMIPLLNEGSAGLKKYADEADNLGLTISGNTGPESERFNDNLQRIGKISTGAANTITADLLPALNVVAEAFVGTAKDGGALALVAGTIKTAFETIAIVGSDVAFTFKVVGTEIGAMLAKWDALLHLDPDGVMVISEAVKKDLAQARVELDEFQQRILNPPKVTASEERKDFLPDITNPAKDKAIAAEQAHQDRLAGMHTKNEIERLEKEYAHTAKLVQAQQERFTAIRQVAEDANASDLERATLVQERQLFDLELQRFNMANDHALSLEGLQQFEDAEAQIILSNSEKIRIATLSDDKRIVDGKIQYQKLSLDSMGAFFGMAKGLMNSHSRAAFEIGKASAVAETVINTYKSATAAYSAMASIPYVGPALGIAAAAAAIASGMAQVSAIQSTSFGSGGAGGGSYGGATSSANGGQATPNYPAAPALPVNARAAQAPTVVNIHMPSSGVFDAPTVRTLIEQIKEQVGDGVNINITST